MRCSTIFGEDAAVVTAVTQKRESEIHLNGAAADLWLWRAIAYERQRTAIVPPKPISRTASSSLLDRYANTAFEGALAENGTLCREVRQGSEVLGLQRVGH